MTIDYRKRRAVRGTEKTHIIPRYYLLLSINQSIIILSEQMQKHCSHGTSIWGDITCREM